MKKKSEWEMTKEEIVKALMRNKKEHLFKLLEAQRK